MLGLMPIIRVVAGSVLVVTGLIAIPLPVAPGIPLVLFGLTLGFSWHPKGLRLIRKTKARLGRWWRERQRGTSGR
jgi:hypothetical protein